ncbi:MAG: ribosome biogenesis GTPase Der [Bacillota bacterium]
MIPVVAIVGRPNVGKSSLFNRLLQRRQSIVEAEPGVTRDRLYGRTDWNGRDFTLVDTGGLEPGDETGLRAATARQAKLAVHEADLVLLVVDVKSGLTAVDREVADIVRRSGKTVFLVTNKADDGKGAPEDFFELGLGQPYPVSAAHGLGTGDLLDAIVAHLPEAVAEAVPEAVHVAVVGRPNVGKSSLVNSILGEERVITSAEPGTTRDAVDVMLSSAGRDYVLIDTAGLRKRSRVDAGIERYSVVRALRAVDRCQVAVVVLEAHEPVKEQDKRIIGYAQEAGKGLLLAVNKWDLAAEAGLTAEDVTAGVREALQFVPYAKILLVSAATGLRVGKILPAAAVIAATHAQRVDPKQLKDTVTDAWRVTPPRAEGGRRPRLLQVEQVTSRPPGFAFRVTDPQAMHFSYKRYLENRLRQQFEFDGTPIRLFFRKG